MTRRTRPCSTGTCGPAVISCYHVGHENSDTLRAVVADELAVVPFAVTSYAQWAWKIGEARTPPRISRWMTARRKAKKRRIKAAQRRQEDRYHALHHSG